MKFKITRTGQWILNEPPCEEAKLYNDQGRYKEYYVDINGLDDLLKLQKKYDRLIIESTWNQDDHVEAQIEIYDDYRE